MLQTTDKTSHSSSPEISAPVALVVAFAADLARRGRYVEAERLLLGLPNDVVTPSVPDLLARVYAQQARYAEAEAQWTNAVQLDPSNEEYLACLKAAERLRSGAPWHLGARWRLATAIALIAIVLFAILVKKQPRSQPSTVSESQRVRIAAPVESPKSELPTFHLAKATVNRTDNALEIRFNDGLFSGGTRFSKAGKESLQEFAEQISSKSSSLRLELRGCTDLQRIKSENSFRDNPQLGLARAEQVALFLHQAEGFPLNRISISTAISVPEPKLPASSNLPVLSQRTVTIRVWVAED
jgi:flagellar motor protein MotB